MKKIELCIRDASQRIVGWTAGYSELELNKLLAAHRADGWHISYAEYTNKGLR